jgi:hypothetical protein
MGFYYCIFSFRFCRAGRKAGTRNRKAGSIAAAAASFFSSRRRTMIGMGYNGSGRVGEVQNNQRNREFLLMIIKTAY